MCNREVFQRAPFIVQITNGTFMPPDKWQMIIYPDTTETTHLSCRYTQHKHTVDVSVCLCAAKVQLCTIIGSCYIWRGRCWVFFHMLYVMIFVPGGVFYLLIFMWVYSYRWWDSGSSLRISMCVIRAHIGLNSISQHRNDMVSGEKKQYILKGILGDTLIHFIAES